MTDKDKIRAEIERRILRNKRNKVFEDVPEKRHQLIIEGQLLGELKHFIDSLQEEPVSNPIDFEKELYRAFGQVKDFTLGIAIAKRFYDMGRKHNEPVSEELDEAASRYAKEEYNRKSPATLPDRCRGCYAPLMYAFKAGAKWQIAKLMTNVIDAQCFGFQGAALFSFRLPADNYLVGSEVKVIVIKED